MPISAPDDTLARLRSLVSEFKAKRLVLLGDIVHRAVAVAPLLEQLSELAKLKEETELVLLAGNHDRRFARIGTGLALRQEYRAGENLFLHGDRLPSRLHERCVIGHEHPGISLGDGVATSRRYPCFLIAENLLVLPAFSNWSANGSVPRGESMSPLARKAEIAEAIAILDGKLLRVPLPC